MKKINIIISIILLLFCLGYFFMIGNLPDRNFQNTLNSSFMPYLLLIILTVLSLFLLVKNFLKGTHEICNHYITRKDLFGIAAITTMIFLYVFIMEFAGFIVTTPFVIFTLMKLTGSSSLKEAIIVSLSASFLIYFFFDFIFKVQLPSGIIM